MNPQKIRTDYLSHYERRNPLYESQQFATKVKTISRNFMWLLSGLVVCVVLYQYFNDSTKLATGYESTYIINYQREGNEFKPVTENKVIHSEASLALPNM